MLNASIKNPITEPICTFEVCCSLDTLIDGVHKQLVV